MPNSKTTQLYNYTKLCYTLTISLLTAFNTVGTIKGTYVCIWITAYLWVIFQHSTACFPSSSGGKVPSVRPGNTV